MQGLMKPLLRKPMYIAFSSYLSISYFPSFPCPISWIQYTFSLSVLLGCLQLVAYLVGSGLLLVISSSFSGDE
jgi:hypothetical protein